MKYTLRPYQQNAVDAVINAVNNKLDNGSVAVLPTGAGKSLIIAEATRLLDRPTLIICPSKELLEQNRDKLLSYVESSDVGVFSASMNQKKIKKFTLCTLGSIFRKPELFTEFGLIIIDECDLIPEEGMFKKFKDKVSFITNKPLTIIGFTATPFRLEIEKEFRYRVMTMETSIKMITVGSFWKRIIYNIDNWDLVKAGYILPVKVIEEESLIPFDMIKESGSDFSLSSYSFNITRQDYRIITAINKAKSYYNRVLVFCPSVETADRLSNSISDSAVVSAKTNKKEREEIIQDFRDGIIKVVLNVGVLTCGFDLPELDCIVLIRPTKSLRLYYQMVGRSVRLCNGKKFGTLIDLTGTTKFLGRIESIQIKSSEENGRKTWGVYTDKGRMDGKVLYTFTKEL